MNRGRAEALRAKAPFEMNLLLESAMSRLDRRHVPAPLDAAGIAARNRLPDLLVGGALASFSLLITAWLLLNDLSLINEDGFYYLKLAQNLARGLGSTFDGRNPTNGYHPLWVALQIPLFWLTNSPERALTLSVVLQGLFAALGVALMYAAARLMFRLRAATLAAFVWILLTYRVSLNGLEFSVHALGVLAVAYAYLRWFAGGADPPPRAYLMLGALLSLTFLARLDTLLLAILLSAFLFGDRIRRDPRALANRQLAAFLLPLSLTALVYFSVNALHFNALAPVSALVKRSWSAELLLNDPLAAAVGRPLAKLAHLLWPLRGPWGPFKLHLSVGTFGAAAIWLYEAVLSRNRGPGRDRDRFPVNLLPFILYSLTGYLAAGIFFHGSLSYPAWYFVIQPWLTAVVVSGMFDRLIRRFEGLGAPFPSLKRLIPAASRLSWAALLVVLPALTIMGLADWRSLDRRGVSAYAPLHLAASWAAENLAQDAVVGSWNAGVIGYRSGVRVINLDGIVNSSDYFRTGREDLCRYWREQGVTHLVDVFEAGEALSVVPTYRSYAHCADSLHLLWSDDRFAETWRVEAYAVQWNDE